MPHCACIVNGGVRVGVSLGGTGWEKPTAESVRASEQGVTPPELGWRKTSIVTVRWWRGRGGAAAVVQTARGDGADLNMGTDKAEPFIRVSVIQHHHTERVGRLMSPWPASWNFLTLLHPFQFSSLLFLTHPTPRPSVPSQPHFRNQQPPSGSQRKCLTQHFSRMCFWDYRGGISFSRGCPMPYRTVSTLALGELGGCSMP